MTGSQRFSFQAWALVAQAYNRMLNESLLLVFFKAEASELSRWAYPHSEEGALSYPEDEDFLEVNEWIAVQWPSLSTMKRIGSLPPPPREAEGLRTPPHRPHPRVSRDVC